MPECDDLPVSYTHLDVYKRQVIIIISREFIISGFRLVAAEKGVTIAASYWGKVKTFVQMAMSIFLVFHFQAEVFRIIESILIYASVILTIISLVDYIYKKDVYKRQEQKQLEDVHIQIQE